MRSILCTPRRRCEQVSTAKTLDSMSEALSSSNSRKNPYVSSESPPHSFKYSETPNISKDPIELIRKRLVYSDDNVRTPAARIFGEKFAEGSNIVDKIVPDAGKSEKESGDHLRYFKAAAWETYPITKLENYLERLYGDKVPTRSKNNEETVQKNILKDCSCSCSPTSDKTRNKVENVQLEHVCSCKQYDKKYKALFGCERSIFNKIASKNIGIGGEENNHTAFNVERKIKFNTNYDSMGCTKLNTSEDTKYENFKGNTSVRFLTSTPKSTVSKGLLTENVPNYCTNVDCDSTNYSTINFRSVDDPSTKAVHRIGPENDLRNVSRDTTRIANFYTNKNCNLTNCCLSGQDTKCVNTTVSCKSIGTVTDSSPVTEKNFYYSKFEQEPKGTASTAMDALEGMLLGIRNYHDKSRMKYGMQEYQHSDVKCRNIDCNVVTDVNHNTVDCMKPECIRMLEEIKECTKTLEEQLTIMNKSIKVKKSKQRKDIVTQEPEKENVYIQQPSFNEFRFVRSTQDLEMKLKNKSFQENDEKSRRLKKMHRELKKETFLQSGKRITKLEEPKCCNERERIHNFKKETLLQSDKTIKELDECKCCREDDCKSSNERERIHNFNITMLGKPKYYKEDNSKYSSEREGIHNSKKLLQKSENKSSSSKTKIGNYTFSFTQLKPPTASVGDDRDLSEKICLCPFPDRTSIFSNRNLLKRHEKETRLSGCTISLGNVNQNRSNCPDKTLTMLFLTKGVNNSYLKSRYKRMVFKNFKPKCLMNETNNKNSETSKRRRSQVPSVFRQLKPVQCKIERSESTGNNENICCRIRNQPSCKMSNLLNTVCTQSSNLYITTATSVSRVSFINNSDDYDKESIPDRSGACILS